MHVFMLGWEFPPYIAGGLGTACYGLTKALSRLGVQITFVLPKGSGTEYTSHVQLLSPQSRQADGGGRPGSSVVNTFQLEETKQTGEFSTVTFKSVQAGAMYSPYQSSGGQLHSEQVDHWTTTTTQPGGTVSYETHIPGSPGGAGSGYEGDILTEAYRYAQLCLEVSRGVRFDVIHAHDWMTFPAGMALAAATSKPLVVHVHSTEFDRAGEHVHQGVYDIERRGMHAAMRVVAVSFMTKSIVQKRYGVDPAKIDVVYNGIDVKKREPQQPDTAPPPTIKKTDKIVLFLGRITMQKGPEYFIEAAKKVLEKFDKVKFVVAGAGDMAPQVMDLAMTHGISRKVIFTGFLRGEDVERVFKMADVYVMPSVSEPFGIAPLEAISHDVPVIISKTSGVAEVLKHALKVDFWDTHEIANKILAVLKHPPLSNTLREHADLEVRQLTWEDSAEKCRRVYESAQAAMGM